MFCSFVVLPIIMSLYIDSPTAFNEKIQLQFIPDVIYLTFCALLFWKSNF